MQIRTYDELDPYEVQKLTFASFGWVMEERWVRTILRRDPRYLDGYALYAVERGKPLAQVVPMRMAVRLKTGVEEVGGLQGVCSHPSVWGKGYARRLMEHVQARFREMGLQISTLTSSRNTRGYSVYQALGYVDLAPFYSGSRSVPRNRRRPKDIRIRTATGRDLPTIQKLFESYTRDLRGWTARHPDVFPALGAWCPKFLDRYRIVERGGAVVGYLRTDPARDPLFEEAIAPRTVDLRAAVAAMEARVRGKVATTTWITCRKDQERFRSLGYDLDGPIGDTTMALSLTREIRTRNLPALFGATRGLFAHYPSDDF